VTKSFAAQTVAPVASVTSSVTATSTLRVGTSTTIASYTVRNTGDGNLAGKDNGTTLLTNLRGSVTATPTPGLSGGGTFSLTDTTGGQPAAHSSTSYTFTYAPTARATTQNVTLTQALNNGVGDTNGSSTATSTVAVTAVGPVYEAKLASQPIANNDKIQFVTWGGAPIQYRDLMISNITKDAPAGNLTSLSLSFSIIGDPTNEYQISLNGGAYGSTASFVSQSGGMANMIANISIQFTNKALGDGFAQLRVATDEGAAFGGAGAIYFYDLRAVPEPGTLVLLGSGLLGFAALRRRRAGLPATVETLDLEKPEAPRG